MQSYLLLGSLTVCRNGSMQFGFTGHPVEGEHWTVVFKSNLSEGNFLAAGKSSSCIDNIVNFVKIAKILNQITWPQIKREWHRIKDEMRKM